MIVFPAAAGNLLQGGIFYGEQVAAMAGDLGAGPQVRQVILLAAHGTGATAFVAEYFPVVHPGQYFEVPAALAGDIHILVALGNFVAVVAVGAD